MQQLSRFAAPLLAAAAIVYACVPRSSASETPLSTAAASPTKDSAPPTRTQRKALADSIARAPLAASLDVKIATSANAERDVRFVLHVTNRAEKNVELMFPSGQTHDFVVKDAAGREVWRWSEGRMFTQALQSKLLGGSATATYQETWKPGARAAGRYTVVATLRSTNHDVMQVAEFALP